jgi:hypothetical protein
MKPNIHFWSQLAQFFLEWDMFQIKDVKKTETLISRQLTFFEKRDIYEIMWTNIVQSDRAQMQLWYMRIACWITKATNTHSHYVILIVFPLQQCPQERASVLRFTYITCLAISPGTTQTQSNGGTDFTTQIIRIWCTV